MLRPETVFQLKVGGSLAKDPNKYNGPARVLVWCSHYKITVYGMPWRHTADIIAHG